MTGDVRIENLNIGTLIVVPEGAPESTFAEQIFDFLREQREAGALTIMGSDGYPLTEDTAESEDPPTPDEQAEAEQARADELVERYAHPDVSARAVELRSVIKHASEARRLEGFMRSYSGRAKDHKSLERRHKNAVEVASMALGRACAHCDLDCALRENIERWIDVHPYKDDRTGKRRKGSSDVEAVESRTGFEKALDAGVEADEQVHCDPAERA
jgi:hypothetical protein